LGEARSGFSGANHLPETPATEITSNPDDSASGLIPAYPKIPIN
jgi:hypothetical protein